jgi:hypothetical protein
LFDVASVVLLFATAAAEDENDAEPLQFEILLFYSFSYFSSDSITLTLIY